MTNANFLFGAYGVVAAIHVVYLLTLRSRGRQLKEELDRLRERAARKKA